MNLSYSIVEMTENYLNKQRFIFLADTILNWLVGLALLLIPFDSLIMLNPPVIAGWVYRLIGLGYLGFALWQTINQKNSTAPKVLLFAFWMVVLPTLFMAWALIAFHHQLHPIARILLWIGELYMFILCGWYGHLYQLENGE